MFRRYIRRRYLMNEQKEIRAKSLEIAVSILGGSADSPLDKYLPLADLIAEYINTGRKDKKPSSDGVSTAEVYGV
jgi:hypothetical protein